MQDKLLSTLTDYDGTTSTCETPKLASGDTDKELIKRHGRGLLAKTEIQTCKFIDIAFVSPPAQGQTEHHERLSVSESSTAYVSRYAGLLNSVLETGA